MMSGSGEELKYSVSMALRSGLPSMSIMISGWGVGVGVWCVGGVTCGETGVD